MNAKKKSRKGSFARYWDDVLDPTSNSPQALEYRRQKKMREVARTPLAQTLANLLNVQKKPDNDE